MVPEVIAEGECACLLFPTERHDVDMICVRPGLGTMEEWTEGIVFVWDVDA